LIGQKVVFKPRQLPGLNFLTTCSFSAFMPRALEVEALTCLFLCNICSLCSLSTLFFKSHSHTEYKYSLSAFRSRALEVEAPTCLFLYNIFSLRNPRSLCNLCSFPRSSSNRALVLRTS